MLNLKDFFNKYNSSLTYDKDGIATSIINMILFSNGYSNYFHYTHFHLNVFPFLTGDVNNYNYLVLMKNVSL
ncbi:MAG: hypothetical protein EOP34_06045 [Rickettsiales bacterium]|nr:MAG: hypothetical protein EOP34_06045 [Rickettsiales bacterium]